MRKRKTNGATVASSWLIAVLMAVLSSALPVAVHAAAPSKGAAKAVASKQQTAPSLVHFNAPGEYDCGFRPPEVWLRELRTAVDRGEIPDPTAKPLPVVPPRIQQQSVPVCIPTPNPSDIFPFEDSTSLLLTNFSGGALTGLMINAANALMASEGDNFDFIGFWINFTPNHTIGAAFYQGFENDVSGIGQGLFNARASAGLAGNNVEGFIMMWNVNSSFWQPGTGSNASFTRLVLGQESEHRFGMFLPGISGGRQLQGDDFSCGRSAHWNFRVDGQGSGMEIAEWVGASPATRVGGSLNFNTDIGGVFSYTDLYLMGYVSPAEMDAGNSELRYLDGNTNCTSPFSGAISNFGSADIIATAGVRSPSSTTAQKDFRTGWIMIHLPGAPPTTAELTKAAGIIEQWSLDWNFGTLGRGTMNNTFRATCDPVVDLQPVGADMPHSIVGNQIIVPEGGARVTLDLLVSDWIPNPLQTYDIQVDAAGYTSGDMGTLSPVVLPDPSAGAFIDTGRGDYLFSSVSSTESVDTTTLDYKWSGASAGGPVFDPGTPRYAGSLVLDVSPDARGTFEIALHGEPNTTLTSDGATPLSPLLLGTARITVAPGNTSCGAAREIICDTSLTFDNSAVSGAPNPGYPCGFGSSHDGTMWFKFTATNTSARLQSCNSLAQDSTFSVFGGTCGALGQIACGEDDCGPSGFLTDQTVTGLTVGETYLIQFSAWQPSDRGEYTLDLSCAVTQAAQPQHNPSLSDDGFGLRNRYLSFLAGQSGRTQSIRVTARSLPAPFDVLDGQQWWVGEPTEVSENSGKILPADAPGFPTFQAARLQCTPFAMDWSTVGVINVSDDEIVPGGVYDVQLVDAGLESTESAFSVPLTLFNSVWGDLARGGTSVAGAPDGSVDIPVDAVAVLDTFRNLPIALPKSRTDLVPEVPDWLIDITDVLGVVDAFRGLAFPFPAPSPCP